MPFRKAILEKRLTEALILKIPTTTTLRLIGLMRAMGVLLSYMSCMASMTHRGKHVHIGESLRKRVLQKLSTNQSEKKNK